MREIVIRVKVQRMHRQQTFILPHLIKGKISVKVVILHHRYLHDCESRRYRFEALEIGFSIFIL